MVAEDPNPEIGWHVWIRTRDPRINSALLYHLSYMPTVRPGFLVGSGQKPGLTNSRRGNLLLAWKRYCQRFSTLASVFIQRVSIILDLHKNGASTMSETNERDVYVITKHLHGDRDVERHFVTLPHYNEKGWYVNGISIDAFRRRMQKRHIRSHKRGEDWVAQAMRVSFWFRVQFKSDFDSDQEIWAKVGVKDRTAVEFHHKSLQAFYEHIGYDPKKNKLAVEPTRL